jgi:hypothetical protein
VSTGPQPPVLPTADHVVNAFNNLPAPDKKRATQQLKNTGLFDFDSTTRTAVWIGVFALLGIALIGALVLINTSYGVTVTTTTGTGANAVTATTRPDMSAAWAAISAVIAGVVGILVPSPKSSS